jgi:glutamate N-acetyltransferase/amino-acid N-acetyltransferase
MPETIEYISGGTITSSAGFLAGATYTGINNHSKYKLDLGLLFSQNTCNAAAVYTANLIKAAPLIICQQRLPSSGIHALIVNSGVANACTGDEGLEDARQMAIMAATKVHVSSDSVLPMSTGVIGRRLPLDLIKQGLADITLSKEGGHDFARAIMTTDTRPKEYALSARSKNCSFTIGGVAKGAGMIAPNMATTLCFITTDAQISADLLQQCLKKAVDVSFNMIVVDGDTSTNDTMLIMASGLAAQGQINKGTQNQRLFQRALNQICTLLAKSVVSDGEGATRLITTCITGAYNLHEARLAARAIAGSNLVKAAIHGADPNWGRIVAAAGRSGARLVDCSLDLKISGNDVLCKGKQVISNPKLISQSLKQPEIAIDLNLNQGKATATAWGCDLSEEYVTINSDYTT